VSRPGPRLLVIGLGNELRGDDAAGLLVARAIRDRPGAEIETAEHEGEPVALLDLWEGAELVVVADAVGGGAGAAAGTVHRFDAGDGPLPALFGGPSTHALGLAETIELARVLGRLPARLIVFGIEGERFGAGEPPSPAVLEAVEPVAEAAVAVASRGPGTGIGSLT
jgi:hydrogenase maturation protease